MSGTRRTTSSYSERFVRDRLDLDDRVFAVNEPPDELGQVSDADLFYGADVTTRLSARELSTAASIPAT